MSNKREREKRREQRLQEETKVDAGERRTRLLQFGAGAIFLVLVAVVVLIVASSGGSGGGDATNLKEVSEVDSLVSGVPQNRMVLGKPEAKVELLEYGDLQCPVCKAYSEEILPQVIENKVDNGEAKISFQNFTIIGEQSAPAGAAALAAGEQGRGWNYLELFYRNQGEENSGYATDEFLTAVAKAAGVKDIAKWNEERQGSKLTKEVEATTAQAQRYGFTGTPSFAIRGPSSNGTELVGTLSTPEEFEKAIEEAS
ncbi:MAG TPA: thioredoxin domain-containing protein [Solirubrobacterales bacterium]|jgi:protein-disulfide isomerase|nr:thioredoxin domain-containing protein [Solirubrobacterales bacterium]